MDVSRSIIARRYFHAVNAAGPVVIRRKIARVGFLKRS
jgi:hypothetical protein